MAQFANSNDFKKYIDSNNFGKIQKFTKEKEHINYKNSSRDLRNAFTWLIRKK